MSLLRSHSRSIARLLIVCAAVIELFASGCSRSQPQAAPPPQRPPIEFLGEWGVHGNGPGELDDPAGPAVDVTGRVYFADRGTGFIEKFELGGVPLLSFQNGSLRGATAVAVDSGGAIYVANARAGNIQIFFPEGALLRVFRVAPQRNYDGPFGFSVDALGKTYVPDPTGGRIQVLSPLGRLEKVWKVSSGSATTGVGPVAAIAGPDGFVYVADTRTNRIVKYSNVGAEVAAWQDPADAAAAPLLGLAVSAQHVFALHNASPRLVVWTLDGKQELTDELGGHLDTASLGRASFAVGSGGDMIVLDPSAPRVLHFRIHLDSP